MNQRQMNSKQKILYQQMLEDDHLQPQDQEQENNIIHPLLQLEIELQNGRKVYINPHPQDQPFRLATQFCQEHNLDTDMIDILAQSIKKSINRSHQSYKKQPLLPREITHLQNKKLNYASQSCKTNNNAKSPQYFSKKFSVNSTLSLYDKGQMLQDAKRHWIARQHQHKIIKEMKQCTHKPKINKLSRSLVSQRSISQNKGKSIGLKSNDKQMGKDIYSMRSSILIQSKNPPSGALQQRKVDSNIIRSNSNIFNKLYQDRLPDQISRSKILSEMLKEETHHPIINGVSKDIVGNAKFSQRLQRYQKQKMEKYSKLKKIQETEKENLYKPKTGPAPQNRNVQGLPIGDFLYRKKKKTPVAKPIAQKPIINESSRAIYDKKKLAAFERVFQYLDSKNLQKIDHKLLDLKQVDPELLSIIRPLLEEIQIMQIELNREDFKAALNFLFGTLSPIDKGKILNFNLQSKQSHQESGKKTVEMNKKSEEIARNIGRGKFSIYDYCEIKETIKLQKIEAERIENERREMRECTFEPKIQKKSLHY